MKPVVATTGPREIAAAGLSQIVAGGNAVDAVVAASLAWCRTLTSAGSIVAAGAGLGHVSCLFRARVPGFGLSRPRRLRLLSGESSAASIAVSCAAPALAAILTRWGTVTPVEAVHHARSAFPKSDPPLHDEALNLLATEGVASFSRGAFGVEAARKWGPIAGGLLTRRDLIEARPDLNQASGPYHELWAAWPLNDARTMADTLAPEPGKDAHNVGSEHTLSIIAFDRRGAVAAMVLEAGREKDSELPSVAGVFANTLLSEVSSARAKKVGQEIPLRRAAIVGGEVEQVGVAGVINEVIDILDSGPAVLDTVEHKVGGLLGVRRIAGGQLQLRGAASVELP